jgi:hypothetical protein
MNDSSKFHDSPDAGTRIREADRHGKVGQSPESGHHSSSFGEYGIL